MKKRKKGKGKKGKGKRKREKNEKGIKKREPGDFSSSSPLGGDYLRLPMSLTIAVEGLRALFQDGIGGKQKKSPRLL